jgi:hypothetical protein
VTAGAAAPVDFEDVALVLEALVVLDDAAELVVDATVAVFSLDAGPVVIVVAVAELSAVMVAAAEAVTAADDNVASTLNALDSFEE